MRDNPGSIRPAGVCIGWATVIVLAAGVAMAEEPCEPGEGGYPPECAEITKIVVCDYGQVHDDVPPAPEDGVIQRETAIAAVKDPEGCTVILVGTWMDRGQTIAQGAQYHHFAISLSDDFGRGWFPPSADASGCPNPYPDPRRFMNDCYFIGDAPEFELLPDDCGYTIDPSTWNPADNEICAGGNGYVYFVGLDSATGGGILFTRSPDLAETWGPFPWQPPPPDPPDRRLKHICEAPPSLDRSGVAASPLASSEDVFVYWNDGLCSVIQIIGSDDGGDTWNAQPLDDVASSSWPEKLYSPRGAMDTSDALYVTWTHTTTTSDVDHPNYPSWIEMRSRNSSGDWDPPLVGQDPPPPRVISGEDPFTSLYQLGGPEYPVYTAYSAPSVAVDCTYVGSSAEPGPYHGWIYVVWADLGTAVPPELPDDGSRVRFVRSCDGGVNWSEPITISPDAAHEDAMQFYPMIRVDGRGVIGVSWYDTRNSDGSPVEEYDVYFACSTDGGGTWLEKRVSGLEGEDAFFRSFGLPFGHPADYSGMAADPRQGFSEFYILAMGTEQPAGTEQDIFAYKVSPRAAGDLDGDFDIDGMDGAWSLCWGDREEHWYSQCECAALDFDDDWDIDDDDVRAFRDAFTGPLCDCHGPCHDDPECRGEEGGVDGGGFDGETLEDLPPACDVAAWFLRHLPSDEVAALAKKLADYLMEHPEDEDAEEIADFLACVYAVLP